MSGRYIIQGPRTSDDPNDRKLWGVFDTKMRRIVDWFTKDEAIMRAKILESEDPHP